jgi:hypothetical protein
LSGLFGGGAIEMIDRDASHDDRVSSWQLSTRGTGCLSPQHAAWIRDASRRERETHALLSSAGPVNGSLARCPDERGSCNSSRPEQTGIAPMLIDKFLQPTILLPSSTGRDQCVNRRLPSGSTLDLREACLLVSSSSRSIPGLQRRPAIGTTLDARQDGVLLLMKTRHTSR